MSRAIDKVLPIKVYRVGGTCFTSSQVADMIARTNRKLYQNNTGIRIELKEEVDVPEKSWAYISEATDKKNDELYQLLSQNGAGPNKTLRLFLVKTHLGGHGSWTYDPITDLDPDVWGGAIFITELYNDNDDLRYADLGFLPSNDSLLHELGHVLMQESTHYNGSQLNFFHDSAEMTDDTIFPQQVFRMRGEVPETPIYLVRE